MSLPPSSQVNQGAPSTLEGSQQKPSKKNFLTDMGLAIISVTLQGAKTWGKNLREADQELSKKNIKDSLTNERK